MSDPQSPGDEVAELARLYGVATEYRDAAGEVRHASGDVLLSAVQALGAPVQSPADAADAVRDRARERWARVAEPTTVVAAGRELAVTLRAPAGASGSGRAILLLEDGQEWTLDLSLEALERIGSADVDGVAFSEYALRMPGSVPDGYHELLVELDGSLTTVLVIAAPAQAPAPRRAHGFGVFLPLYALRSSRTLAAADVGDLERLLAAVDGVGGDLVGSTPLFATFPDEPSPYAPASRLFWNELYADLTASPELDRSPDARALLDSQTFQEQARSLAGSPIVDYAATLRLRRPVLELLAEALHREPSSRRDDYHARLAASPEIADYARFRAYGERTGLPWQEWPTAERNGTLPIAEDDPAVRTYAYAQWLVDEQLERLSRRPGAGLYLDQPIGVHPASYDTWREGSSFALGATVGAPPDLFFREGQDWGFPPPHPERTRAERHRYTIACMRRTASRARAMRIDHIMGLHRLWWIPEGRPPADGVYVSYPVEELYAIAALEAHRAGAFVVGEDLGTVPEEVRDEMERRAFRRSYVLQFSARADPDQPVEAPPVRSLASLNTHDTATFAAFWRDAPEEVRDAIVHHLRDTGRLATSGTDSATDVVRGLLGLLAASDTETVLITLEDLWGELEPQNVPGTSGPETRNWVRRARYGLEEMFEREDVRQALDLVARERNRAGLTARSSDAGSSPS